MSQNEKIILAHSSHIRPICPKFLEFREKYHNFAQKYLLMHTQN